jgi:GNAT superfamily N-acetyltransferase
MRLIIPSKINGEVRHSGYRHDPMKIRLADETDDGFLWRILGEAVHWRGEPYDAGGLASAPQLARYLSGWGRAGDAGVVVEVENRPVGAAWYRLFPADDPGYGFVSEHTPELSIGVQREWRKRGIGRRLLTSLELVAREQGYAALSLSVEEANPARRLYERLGYVRVGQVGGAWTMVKDLVTP